MPHPVPIWLGRFNEPLWQKQGNALKPLKTNPLFLPHLPPSHSTSKLTPSVAHIALLEGFLQTIFLTVLRLS